MLSPEVLTELMRRTQASEEILRAAWPSLSVESKLQILTKMQNDLYYGVPSWLLPIVASDPAPVVRYWGLRESDLTQIADNRAGALYRADDDTLEACRLARADTHPLVSALVNRKSGFSEPDAPGARLARLMWVRHPLGLEGLRNHLDALEAAIESGSPTDRELAGIVSEMLRSSQFAARYLADERSWDGWTHNSNLSEAKRLWMLSTKSGPFTAHQIVWCAPTRVEQRNILKDVVCHLPPGLIATLLGRREPEVRELEAAIRTNLAAFPEEIQKQISHNDKIRIEFDLD